MGSGKGSPEYWVAVVKPGRVMFEIAGVPEETAREALRLAANKLPIKCKFVKGEETGVSSNEGLRDEKLSTAELETKLKDLKAELFNLRFQLAINQLDNPMRVSAVKKDIARVKTVLRENEINSSKNA